MKTLMHGRIRYLDVVLKHEWMGNPKGARMQIMEHVARRLEGQGIVKITDKEVQGKAMDSAPRDKMVKGAQKTKRRRRRKDE